MGFQIPSTPEPDPGIDLDEYLQRLLTNSERLGELSSEIHSDLKQGLGSPKDAIAFAHSIASVCAEHVNRAILAIRLLNLEIEKIKTRLDLDRVLLSFDCK